MKIELTEEMASAVIRGLADHHDDLESRLLVAVQDGIGYCQEARNARQERDLAIKDRDEERKADGPAFNCGRHEGQADVAARLRKILDPTDAGHLDLDGLLTKVSGACEVADARSVDAEALKKRCSELTEALALAHRALWDEARIAKEDGRELAVKRMEHAIASSQPLVVRSARQARYPGDKEPATIPATGQQLDDHPASVTDATKKLAAAVDAAKAAKP